MVLGEYSTPRIFSLFNISLNQISVAYIHRWPPEDFKIINKNFIDGYDRSVYSV